MHALRACRARRGWEGASKEGRQAGQRKRSWDGRVEAHEGEKGARERTNRRSEGCAGECAGVERCSDERGGTNSRSMQREKGDRPIGVVRVFSKGGAVATLNSSVGKQGQVAGKALHAASPAPTSSLKITSPPKPTILQRSRFVIRGKVQGVYFRKFTQQKAVELSVFGFVENAEDGSVVGEAEGRLDKMVTFKYWLAHTGSPKSIIESVEFDDETVEARKFSKFDIIR